MNRFKFEAFVGEFPFLSTVFTVKNYDRTTTVLTAEDVNSIRVKRIDATLLSCTPKSFSWDGSLGETQRFTEFSFVLNDATATVLLNCVKQEREAGSNYAHSQTIVFPGESVLEAIDRHGCADNLVAIVRCDREYDSWSGRECTDTRYITIYKVAREDSLPALLEAARDLARREVLAEVNF